VSDRARRIRARASGNTPEEDVQELREALRSGVLDAHWVGLASFVGDTSARAALGGPDPNLEAWSRGLSAWGREVEVRAAFALAKHLEPVWREANPERGEAMSTTLEAIQAWLTPRGQRSSRFAPLEDGDLRQELESAYHAALSEALSGRRREERTGQLGPAGLSVLVAGRTALMAASEDDEAAHAVLLGSFQSAVMILGDSAVKDIVRNELVPLAFEKARL
jgi:hypothetical protein